MLLTGVVPKSVVAHDIALARDLDAVYRRHVVGYISETQRKRGGSMKSIAATFRGGPDDGEYRYVETTHGVPPEIIALRRLLEGGQRNDRATVETGLYDLTGMLSNGVRIYSWRGWR